MEAEPDESQVCGVYFMTDPDKVVEIEVEFMDVSCEFGGLLGVRIAIPSCGHKILKHFNFISSSMDGN